MFTYINSQRFYINFRFSSIKAFNEQKYLSERFNLISTAIIISSFICRKLTQKLLLNNFMKSSIDDFSVYIFFFISRTHTVSEDFTTRNNNVKEETIQQIIKNESAIENNDDNFVHKEYSKQLNYQ